MCIQKIFSSIHTKEHIEMDCFFSEFDMPVRWGLLRLKEMDVLNVVRNRTLSDTKCIRIRQYMRKHYLHKLVIALQAALWIAFLTDFTAIPPTDLGLRPDGTLRTCPVMYNQVNLPVIPLTGRHVKLL